MPTPHHHTPHHAMTAGGSALTFGPGGPRIPLERPIGLATGQPVKLTPDFALAGLVHLTAVSAGASPAGDVVDAWTS